MSDWEYSYVFYLNDQPYFSQVYGFNGLVAKAEALSEARVRLDGLIETRRTLANTVLETASGPWAATFRAKEHGVLVAMASAWRNLGDCAGRCRAAMTSQSDDQYSNLPYEHVTYHPGSMGAIEHALSSRTDLVEPGGDGTIEVDLDALNSYLAEAQDQHETSLGGLFDEVSAVGVRGVTFMMRRQPNQPDQFLRDDSTIETLTPAAILQELPFLDRDRITDDVTLAHDDAAQTDVLAGPVDAVALSNDLLAYASDKKTELEAAGDGEGVPGGPGGPGGVPGDMGIPGMPPPPSPPSSAPPPSPVELPEVAAGEALGVVAGGFSLVDRQEAEDPATFGLLTREELALAAQNDQLPPDLRAAALRVAEDPELFAAVAVVHQPLVADPEMHLQHVSLDDITTFLGSTEALVVLREQAGVVDLPESGGMADGIVTPAELEAAANDVSVAPEVRDAAQFLLDNPVITQRLAAYDMLFPSDGGPVDPQSLLLLPVLDPETGEPVVDPETGRMLFDPAPFSVENLERMATDHERLLELVDEGESTGDAPGSGRMVLGRRDLLMPEPVSSTGDPGSGHVVGRRDFLVPESEPEPEPESGPPTDETDDGGSGRTAYVRRLDPDPTITA